MAEAVTGPSGGPLAPDARSTASPQMRDTLEIDTSNTTVESSSGSESTEMAGKRKDRKKRNEPQNGSSENDDNTSSRQENISGTSIQPLPPTHTMIRPMSPLNSLESSQRSASPHRAKQPQATSPGPQFPSSPNLQSPVGSQIFERNVQEDIAPPQASPSIPSHIKTENHIPPILDASSAALTDDHLDPDSVEIVTHNSHQPVACAPPSDHQISSSWHEDAPVEAEDSVSNYGALDSNDVKRLSFVSFADLVHGEHAAECADHTSNRNSMHLSGQQVPSFGGHLGVQNRSPSPIHSPSSSHGLGTSPPTSMSSPLRVKESSPNRAIRPPNSPCLSGYSPPHSTFGGELNVETMSQALRRTESGDLGGSRSQPMSAVGSGDNALDRDRLFR